MINENETYKIVVIGDINQHGKVNVKDVVTFRKAFIVLENLTNEKLKKQSTNEYPQVTKKKLMQKKTMLNQNDHFDSQILPFYYALNISIDDLKNEIRDIKDMFNRV